MGSGPTLIACEGQDVCKEFCHGLLSTTSRVGTQYVRAAAKLYTKELSVQFEGRSHRLMFDPLVALTIMDKSASPKDITDKYCDAFRGVLTKNITVVFVPVLEEDHWWCAAFHFKDEKIWHIDSTHFELAHIHDDVLDELGGNGQNFEALG